MAFVRWCSWLALILALDLKAAPVPDESKVFTHISEIRAVSAEDAKAGWSVRLKAVVIFHNHLRKDCFIQDETGGIYLARPRDVEDLTPGDFIEIIGTIGPGDFAPIVKEVTHYGGGQQ